MPPNKGAMSGQLPSRVALKTLAKGPKTIVDYAKALPNDLKNPSPVPSTVLSLIAKQRR